MDSQMILYVALAGLGVAGLVIGRWWAVGLSVVIVPVIYLGLDRGWWGSGLGDGWKHAAAFVLAIALALAGAGVLTRRLVRRGAMAVRGS